MTKTRKTANGGSVGAQTVSRPEPSKDAQRDDFTIDPRFALALEPTKSKRDISYEAWEEFKRRPTTGRRNAIIEHYIPFVEVIAYSLHKKLSTKSPLEQSDLFSYGIMGLIGSIDYYDPARRVRFSTFCGLRARGMMYDEIRKQDWVPRLARDWEKRFNRAHAELTDILVREPSDLETAEHLGFTIEEFHKIMSRQRIIEKTSLADVVSRDVMSGRALTVGDLVYCSTSREPTKRLSLEEDMNMIYRRLDHREAMVANLYYEQDFTMRMIGETIGLSESRVCQLHTRLIKKLRASLRDFNPQLIPIKQGSRPHN